MDRIIETLARELGKDPRHVENVVRLLDEGSTVPFIARYRKELHGAMDDTALRMLEFYPDWAAGVDYSTGHKVQRGGKLWRCVQAHTSQAGWEPSTATASLWEEICEAHDGTKYDPIPYNGNMALENGKYYTQYGVLYLCNRDTGNPVYHPLSALVGLYVTVVEVN